MDIETKRKEVKALIDDIKKHSDRLSESKAIPMLELSAILSKMTRLKESTIILKYLLAKKQHHEDDEFGPNRLSIPDIIHPQMNPAKQSNVQESYTEVDDVSGELEEGEELMVEVEVDEEEIQSIDTENVEEEEKDTIDSDDADSQEETEDVVSQFTEQTEDLTDLLDQLEEQDMSQQQDVNEQYSEMEDKSLSDQLQKQPIPDLMSSIGLNERYLYANELFEGEMEEFKSALDQLNQFDTFAEAKTFFNSQLLDQRNWEEDNQLVRALYSLIERRYL